MVQGSSLAPAKYLMPNVSFSINGAIDPTEMDKWTHKRGRLLSSFCTLVLCFDTSMYDNPCNLAYV